ncbi:MAG: hypothetical protein CMH57_01120 [Myxococcales bacterium]|nr:hypothetical protein [Myxococcales bacterium]
MTRRLSHVIAFDDFAFDRAHRGAVSIVGAVYSNLRLDGVLCGEVQRDGSDSAEAIEQLVRGSRFFEHNHMIMLQGIALAGFNVVDIHALSEALEMPVLVVARKEPNMARIREALLTKVEGGEAKWALIEKAGPMEPVADVFVQRAGLSAVEAAHVIGHFTTQSVIPVPLRTAHIIASGVSTGETRGRV